MRVAPLLVLLLLLPLATPGQAAVPTAPVVPSTECALGGCDAGSWSLGEGTESLGLGITRGGNTFHLAKTGRVYGGDRDYDGVLIARLGPGSNTPLQETRLSYVMTAAFAASPDLAIWAARACYDCLVRVHLLDTDLVPGAGDPETGVFDVDMADPVAADIAADGTILLAAPHELVALTVAGVELWRVSEDQGYLGNHEVVEEAGVVFVHHSEMVSMYDLETGAPLPHPLFAAQQFGVTTGLICGLRFGDVSCQAVDRGLAASVGAFQPTVSFTAPFGTDVFTVHPRLPIVYTATDDTVFAMGLDGTELSRWRLSERVGALKAWDDTVVATSGRAIYAFDPLLNVLKEFASGPSAKGNPLVAYDPESRQVRAVGTTSGMRAQGVGMAHEIAEVQGVACVSDCGAFSWSVSTGTHVEQALSRGHTGFQVISTATALLVTAKFQNPGTPFAAHQWAQGVHGVTAASDELAIVAVRPCPECLVRIDVLEPDPAPVTGLAIRRASEIAMPLPIQGAVAPDGSLFVLASADTVVAVDPSGTELWRRTYAPSGPVTQVALTSQGVLVLAGGRIHALSAASGAILGSAFTGVDLLAGSGSIACGVDLERAVLLCIDLFSPGPAKELASVALTHDTTHLAMHPTMPWVYTAGADGVTLRDAILGRVIATHAATAGVAPKAFGVWEDAVMLTYDAHAVWMDATLGNTEDRAGEAGFTAGAEVAYDARSRAIISPGTFVTGEAGGLVYRA